MKMHSLLRQMFGFKVCLAVLFSCGSLQALYLGNPHSPGSTDKGLWIPEDSMYGFQTGFQFDVTLDRRLKVTTGPSSSMDSFYMLWNQGTAALMIAERIEAYGSVGSMQASFSHRPMGSFVKYQTRNQLTAGAGLRVLVYDGKCCAIGVEGGYQFATPSIEWITVDGISVSTRSKLHYDEWQVGLGISKRIEMFLPYLAVKYSNAHAKVTRLNGEIGHPISTLVMRNQDYVGIVAGCTFTTGNYFDFTLETRFIDEQALSLASNLRF